MSLNDNYPGHEHRFSLHYVICNVVPAYHQATATYTFGKLINNYNCTKLHHGNIPFDYTDKKYFQVQFGPMEHCLHWRVR